MSTLCQPRPAPDLAAVLLQLGQLMAAAHLAPDHPWRVLIADTMAASADAAPAAEVSAAPAPAAAEGATFFSLDSDYLIAPSATLTSLLHDLECLYDCGMGGLEAQLVAGDFSSAQWAGVYALRQAGGVWKEVARRVFAGERIEGGQA